MTALQWIGFASLLLFVAVTEFVRGSGALRDRGMFQGIGCMFVLLVYAVLWLVPSLAALLVWALWFRGGAA